MNFSCVIRVPASQLAHLRLDHLQSGVDAPGDGFSMPAALPGVPWEATGYTEWVGATDPGISVGWDWVVTTDSGLLTLSPGSIRTNLMVTDERGLDLGEKATSLHLSRYLASWAWQAAVLEHLKASPDRNATNT